MRPLRLMTALFVFVLLLSTAPLVADTWTGEASFSAGDLLLGKSGGFDVVKMTESDHLSVVGGPSLPCVQVNVALPDGSTVWSIRSLSAKYTELDGTFDVMPCARPRRISNPAIGIPYIKDAAIYGTDAFYPDKVAEQVGTSWDIAGQEFVTLRLYPVQYNPVTGKIRIATSINYEVSYDVNPAFTRKTYNFSERTRAETEKKIRRMAVNDEVLTPIPAWTGPATRSLAPGDYEHVVITTATYQNSFDGLMDYYTSIGVPSTLVTTDWIYSNYSGSNVEKIRAFVIDAHADWGSIYFLIGGDQDKVPCQFSMVNGENIPNDTFFADYDGDWKCEVYLGRAPITSTSEAAEFVSRTLDYMTNPPSGFGDEVFLMGFDLDSVSRGEGLMNYIIDRWLPTGLALSKEYDSESGGHESDVKGYINAGQNLTAHCDHCNTTIVGVGTHHHGSTISNSECDSFNNGSRRGLLNTLGCWPGAIDRACWGEVFVKNTGGGGVGFVGNTRYGWYMPGSFPESYSGRYLQKFFKVIWQEEYNNYHAGEAVGECKNDYYPTGGTYQYIFTEITLLGDPAVPLWTDVPQNPTVAFDGTIDPGFQCFTVNVSSGGTAVDGALVCLKMGTDIYERKLTNSAGNADIVINPLGSGTLDVTVTGPNILLYNGSCTVNGGTIPDLAVTLVLDKAEYSWKDSIFQDLAVANSTGSNQNTKLWLNITLPNSSTYPGSGYLSSSPWPLTVPANDILTGTLSTTVPPGTPTGSYVFNAFIGPDPGIVDEDHKPFEVVN
jgi:hypothetical protein